MTTASSTHTLVKETLHVVQSSNLKGDQSVLAPITMVNSSLKQRRDKRLSQQKVCKLQKTGSLDDISGGISREGIQHTRGAGPTLMVESDSEDATKLPSTLGHHGSPKGRQFKRQMSDGSHAVAMVDQIHIKSPVVPE